MLPARDRLFSFPFVAAPAFTAWQLGHVLASAGVSLQEHGAGRHLPEWSERFLQLATASEAHAAPFQTMGNWLAIVISVVGFLIVHRLGPERAFRVLIVHLSLSWAVQAGLLLWAVAVLAAR